MEKAYTFFLEGEWHIVLDGGDVPTITTPMKDSLLFLLEDLLKACSHEECIKLDAIMLIRKHFGIKELTNPPDLIKGGY